MPEKVLVVENSSLHPCLNRENGCLYIEHSEEIFNSILEKHAFMPRDEAEHDYEHKQVIPYVVIRERDNYLLLKRTAKQSEKRLHNKYSLGIGGHINPDPVRQECNVITNGLYRELGEEVHIDKPGPLSFIGVINDESNSVSRVHLGLLYVIDVLSPQYRVLETDKMTAQWVSAGELKEYYDALETWSQIVYDHYINK